MRISEVVERLLAIKGEHGDLHVLHHDDWDDFVVESVLYIEPGEFPAVVVIEGEFIRIDEVKP